MKVTVYRSVPLYVVNVDSPGLPYLSICYKLCSNAPNPKLLPGPLTLWACARYCLLVSVNLCFTARIGGKSGGIIHNSVKYSQFCIIISFTWLSQCVIYVACDAFMIFGDHVGEKPGQYGLYIYITSLDNSETYRIISVYKWSNSLSRFNDCDLKKSKHDRSAHKLRHALESSSQ